MRRCGPRRPAWRRGQAAQAQPGCRGPCLPGGSSREALRFCGAGIGSDGRRAQTARTGRGDGTAVAPGVSGSAQGAAASETAGERLLPSPPPHPGCLTPALCTSSEAAPASAYRRRGPSPTFAAYGTGAGGRELLADSGDGPCPPAAAGAVGSGCGAGCTDVEPGAELDQTIHGMSGVAGPSSPAAVSPGLLQGQPSP